MNHMRRLGPLRTAWADTGATRWPACPRTSSAPKCCRNAAGSPAGGPLLALDGRSSRADDRSSRRIARSSHGTAYGRHGRRTVLPRSA